MMKSLMVYLAVFCLTLYCFFLYDDMIVGAMLAVEIIYFAFAAVLIWHLKNNVQMTMEPVVPVAEKNQDIHLCLWGRNRSQWFPAHVRAMVRVENTFTGEKRNYMLGDTISQKGQRKLKLVFREETCGSIQIALEYVYVYDLFYLLRSKRKKGQRQQVGILPECHLMAVEVSRRTREYIADAGEYSDRESGDDPSEIYQVREYREYDSIHDIHWKLSAKADEILVKERGKPLGAAVLIWLDLKKLTEVKSAGLRKRGAAERAPVNVLELAASFSLSLLEAKCVHMVAWYEAEGQRIRKKRVSREEHIYELLHRLIHVRLCENGEEMYSCYEKAFRGEAFSTIVTLQMDGAVDVGGERVKIPAEDGNILWEKLYFTV